MASMDNEENISKLYEEFKKKIELEKANYRSDLAKLAEKEGYFYNPDKDTYEEIPNIRVYEVIITSIGLDEINVVKRFNWIDGKNYDIAKKAITEEDRETAYNLACKLGSDADFFNTLQECFGSEIKKLSDLAGFTKDSIMNFIHGEDYALHPQIEYAIKGEKIDTIDEENELFFNEVAGSFEVAIPYYHVSFSFFNMKEGVLERLLKLYDTGGLFLSANKCLFKMKEHNRKNE